MCKCLFCETYNKYKWAVVMECGCSCHDGDGMSGHDGLCCEFPNGLKRNNPHHVLETREFYDKILNKFMNDA